MKHWSDDDSNCLTKASLIELNLCFLGTLTSTTIPSLVYESNFEVSNLSLKQNPSMTEILLDQFHWFESFLIFLWTLHMSHHEKSVFYLHEL